VLLAGNIPMRFSVIFLFFAFLTVVSCQKKSVPVQSNRSQADIDAERLAEQKKEKRKNFPVVSKFTSFFKENIKDSANSSVLILMGERLFIDSLTLDVYRTNSFGAFWNDSAKCHHIIHALHDSRFDGLNPKDYGIPGLDSLFKACFMGDKKRNDTLYWKLELSVTKNYLYYLHHLSWGKTDPETIFKDWDYKRVIQPLYTPVQISKLLVKSPDILITELRPQFQMYKILRSVLYAVDSFAKKKSFEWDPIPYIGKDLIPGDTSWIIIKVKHRLLTFGLGHEDPVTNVFNEDLVAALDYFQQHVNLIPNGKIDKSTIDQLNYSVKEIENVIRVNMERCRWLLKGVLPDYYIIVNIADYNLRVYKNHKQVYKTKVVVGATKKETPVFHSSMTTIELNPHWTVPISITGDEILPKLKTDPNYLNRNNMELLRGDSVVYITDFSSYSKDNFPFVIRQKPGENDSLGKVKFLFPNPYSVYFHDTPSKSLFEKDTRAFSHGCVRVQKPLDLATFLLSDQGMTRKQIDEVVKSGKNTAIALKTKIPVIITYWTCFIDQKNHLVFFKDIYGRDKLILKELDN
jgi:L,D-transpeptidase YcbB